jgi:cell division transport system permease protein
MVSADSLPSSLEVNAKDPTMLKDLEILVQGVEGVELIDYQKDVVESLVSWTNTVRITGGFLGGILTFNSILTIMTVIGMRIATKKDEIEILKLIGASPSYIRSPFVLEGGIYGVIGGALSWIALCIVAILLRDSILFYLGIIPDIGYIFHSITGQGFLYFQLISLSSLTFFGFLLGCLGGIVSVNRYLR